VDFGTLSGRAVVVRVADGAELGSAVSPYGHAVVDRALPATGASLPPDWALQVPGDWLDVLRTAVPEALGASGVDPADVIGIGTDFTACTVLPTTTDGTPLCELERFLMQVYAEVIRRPISIIRSEQWPALGSAIFAAVAAGAFPDVHAAAGVIGKVQRAVYVPDEERAKHYDALYAEYLQLHDHFGRGGRPAPGWSHAPAARAPSGRRRAGRPPADRAADLRRRDASAVAGQSTVIREPALAAEVPGTESSSRAESSALTSSALTWSAPTEEQPV
jgi:ribulose kinase